MLPRDDVGAGPAVVLLHAGIAERTMWAGQLDELRKPLLESFENARRAYEDLASRNNGDSLGTVGASEAKLESAAYTLRILAAMR